MRHLNLSWNKKPIPVLGQGCDYHLPPNDPSWDKARSSLEVGIEAGLTLLDTAEVYSAGKSEEIVGELALKYGDDLFICSKVSPENFRKNDLLMAAEGSLRRLKRETIDLYQLHWPNPSIPQDEIAEALATLLEQGKVQHCGVSNFSLKELQSFETAFQPHQIRALQAEYNLFDRSVEQTLLPYCKASEKLLLAYCPLEQGSVTGDRGRHEALKELAAKYRASNAQIALAWLMTRPCVVPIPRSLNHTAENAAAASLELSADDAQTIDALFPFDPVLVALKDIAVVSDGLQGRRVYTTLEQAKKNPFNLRPSPEELAQQFADGEFLKPIRVRPSESENASTKYELIEGRLRYWAWAIAFGYSRPIPTLVRDV